MIDRAFIYASELITFIINLLTVSITVFMSVSDYSTLYMAVKKMINVSEKEDI